MGKTGAAKSPLQKDPFFGRHQELAFLSERYNSNKSEFLPVYGRRRVGKSTLLQHFIVKRKGMFFVGKEAPAQLQINEFMGLLAEVTKQPLLRDISVTTWGKAFDYFEEYALSTREKFILVLDEFQWMVGESRELPSIIQERWDHRWKRSGNLFLVLCGSYIGFMEREVLGEKSPLFGRRTGQILLKPFNYLEAAEFHPRLSVQDKACVWFLCGGIPYYLEQFSQRESIEQNIIQQMLNDGSVLFREPEFLLREELREVGNFRAVLMAVATGSLRLQEIETVTGLEKSKLSYYVNQLIELGYVQKDYPLFEGEINQRKVVYRLQDPLLRFWYRFVFSNASHLALRGPTAHFERFIKAELDSYFGSCFELLCREALPFIYKNERVNAAFNVGSYWDHKSVQIDVVGLREDQRTDLGECKWGKVTSGVGLLNELERKVELFPNKRNATICRRIFTRYKLPLRGDHASGVQAHDLRDLYELKPYA
ncbi:MAG: ATP-binding protein [Sumerlaeia bacterium]